MNPLTDLADLRATHASTLKLLADVSEYLMRLPPVPATHALCRTINEHLRDPQNFAVNEAARLAHAVRLHDGIYTPAGIPLLLIDIDERQLTLGTEIPKSRAGEAEALATLLRILRSAPTRELIVGPRRG
jgi:hypothetical protein